MSHHQSKDPAFKLFGRKIPVPDSQIPAIPPSKNYLSEKTEVKTQGLKEDNSVAPDECSASVKCKEESQAQVTEVQGAYKPKEEGAETDNTDQEKVFKKPDKVLPCPRCNSLETKFCYFNNYNVNQPRHFCKNCQRYWTAGGTMRNVPIGAGRRKNKHLASQYRHIIVSPDGMPIARIENSESANHQLISSIESETTLRASAGNGMVLKFGPEAPLCESMDTVLNLGEKKGYVEGSTVNAQENGEESSLCGSTVTASSGWGNEILENLLQKDRVGLPGSPSQLSAGSAGQPLHCCPVPPLVFPWNPGWNNVASVAPAQNSSSQACMPNGSDLNQTQWSATPVLAVPGFCPPNIPIQFVPAAYWGCMPMWTSGTGNVSLNASNGCLSPSSSTSTSCCSGNGSPTLGKHSRDLNFIDEEKAEKSVLIPKTLRIDVPNEASKSPLWASLGLQTDQKDPISKGAVFKTFETKAEGKAHIPDAAHILEANPAALSRSHTFQESS